MVRYLKNMRMLNNVVHLLFSESEKRILEVGKVYKFKRSKTKQHLYDVKVADVAELQSKKSKHSKKLFQILLA